MGKKTTKVAKELLDLLRSGHLKLRGADDSIKKVMDRFSFSFRCNVDLLI